MTCSHCGSRNADTARFCGSCGSRLAVACPSCGAGVAADLRYCDACGSAMPPAGSSEPARDRVEAEPWIPSERRLVSVLFVDLEDFTALAESLDPEDVRNLQARYFEAARSVVAHYDGMLEKFIGDAVMAVWGARVAHEDDGERAVRAGLELLAAVARLRGAVAGQPLSARGAVGTGEVAVTPGVEGQGIVAGDLVNTSARLQAAAPSNGILVDDTTRRVVGDAISFTPVGAMTLKGKSRPVTAWLAVESAERRPKGRAAGHAGPFIGRRTEFSELVELFERTVATRRSRIVSVLGIAGIGKSRLVWEFERYLDDLPEILALHIGRTPSYGEGITFAPIAEMVRRRARISEGTEIELAARQLRRTLDELVPDETERRWIEPRLATLLAPGSDASFDRDELFAAWRRFFECVSEWAPAILIFEDLQWADPALLDFIDHLSTWTRAHPLLIVTLARPELLDRCPTWGVGQHAFTAIQLEPLPDEQMVELLVGLEPDLPYGVVRRIVDRAGGVPLYAVEVLRMLVDRGQAVGRVPGSEPLDTLEEMQIPDTLRSLVSARIDALPVAERRCVLSAAVLGGRFHPDALAAIGRLEASTARDLIAALSRRELLTVDDEPRSPGRGQISFVQEVVRDVAYSTVSLRDRRTLHLAAADHLEALHDDELVEAVADHLLAAHDAARSHPDAPAVARRAVAALQLAAARALALRVPTRALEHLQRALDLVDDDETRAMLWGETAVAARAASRFDLAESYLRQSIAWFDANGRHADAARARAQLASILLSTERHGSALGDLEAALAGVEDLGSDPSSAELSGQLARAHVLVGDDQVALEWADRTLDAAGRLGLPAVSVDALITRGTAEMRLGRDEAGLGDLHRAIDEAQGLGLLGAELRARNNLAWLMAPDDPRATMATARAGLDLATRMGVGDMALQLAEVVSAVAIDTGEWDEALAVLGDVRDRPKAPAHRVLFAANEATLRALRGDPTAPEVLAALEPLDPDTDPQILAAIDQARAWIAFVDGRSEDARQAAESAGGRSLGAERHAAIVLAARAGLWLGDEAGVRALSDDLDRMRMSGRAVGAAALTIRAGSAAIAGEASAWQSYASAIESWRALRLPLHLALCLVERRRFLGPAVDPGLEAGGEEAAEILTALGARGVLAAIRPVAASVSRSRGR
jgi:class 3 adenylate cyclase